MLLLSLLLALSFNAAGDQNLREIARGGKPVNVSVDCDCGLAPDFRDVVAKSDVIVRGTITEAVARLTRDEKEIETIYTLTVTDVVAQRNQLRYTRPGPVAPFKFIQKGGRLTIDGVPVSWILEWLPPIPVGTEGLFLLTESSEPDLYMITVTPHGAFKTLANQVSPMNRKKGTYPEYTDIPISTFLSELEKLRLDIWQTAR